MQTLNSFTELSSYFRSSLFAVLALAPRTLTSTHSSLPILLVAGLWQAYFYRRFLLA